MKCPFCGSESTKVVDTRTSEEQNAIRRRRQCEDCTKRFTTYETVELSELIVIKKDNSREIYSREKIKSGIIRSCHKLPISVSQIDGIIDLIEGDLYGLSKQEVESSLIGEIVMKRLLELNQVAYVRFMSIYRAFTDVNTFVDEIKKMQDHAS